jgi:steroid delta-isomerase-like uncharacterized protein
MARAPPALGDFSRLHRTEGAEMSREDVERVDDQGIAAWDHHDADGFAGLFADDFEWTDLTIPEPMRTREEARQYAQAWFTAFPDMRVQRTNRLVDGDSVAGELEFTGTNTGPMLMGGGEIPATGRSVLGKGSYFARVEGGKIVRFSTHPDVAGLLAQLGLMPQM